MKTQWSWRKLLTLSGMISRTSFTQKWLIDSFSKDDMVIEELPVVLGQTTQMKSFKTFKASYPLSVICIVIHYHIMLIHYTQLISWLWSNTTTQTTYPWDIQKYLHYFSMQKSFFHPLWNVTKYKSKEKNHRCPISQFNPFLWKREVRWWRMYITHALFYGIS